MMQKIKQAFGVQDMTVGRPMDSLVRFSIPLLLGNLAQQLYNTVDSIVVGKYVGDTALAAVGTAGPILNLLIVLFMGIATGASILSAQYFGAKDREQLSRAVGSTIFLTIASGLVMTVVGYFVSPWLVAMVTPPPEVAPGATEYLQIIFIGILGCGMYNILSGVLRGLGDSLNPLIYLVIASLMNIVLDLYFVRDLGMGVAGVAWATIMAQAVSGVLCLIRLVRMRDTVDINRHTLRLNGQLCRRLHLPQAGMNFLVSCGTFVKILGQILPGKGKPHLPVHLVCAGKQSASLIGIQEGVKNMPVVCFHYNIPPHS